MNAKNVVTVGLGIIAAVQLQALAIAPGERAEDIVCVRRHFTELLVRYVLLDCAATRDNLNGVVDRVELWPHAEKPGAKPLGIFYNPAEMPLSEDVLDTETPVDPDISMLTEQQVAMFQERYDRLEGMREVESVVELKVQ